MSAEIDDIKCEEMKKECALAFQATWHELKLSRKDFKGFVNIIWKGMSRRIKILEKRVDKLSVRNLLITGGAIAIMFLINFFGPTLLKLIFKV